MATPLKIPSPPSPVRPHPRDVRRLVIVLAAVALVAIAAIAGPAFGPRERPNATIQRAQSRTQVIVFTGQSATAVTLALGETATLTGTWEVDGQTVYVTRVVNTAAHGSFFVELRPAIAGVELLDVPSAKFLVNAP